MYTPIFFWYCVVGIVLIAALARFIEYVAVAGKRHRARAVAKRHIPFIGMCRDEEIFFAPGDPLHDEDDDDDDRDYV